MQRQEEWQGLQAEPQVITKALIGSLVAAGLALGVQTYRLAVAEGDAQEARAELAEAIADWEAERARQQEAARANERRHAEELNAIAARYEQEKADAEAQRERELAALRDGSVRLRKLWQGCEAAAGSVPGASPSAVESDAVAELRRQAAADLVRVGADCDAHVRGLQQVIRQR